MVLSIEDKSELEMEKDTGMVFKYGLMEADTKDTGKIIWLMAEANSIILMEMSTMVFYCQYNF